MCAIDFTSIIQYWIYIQYINQRKSGFVDDEYSFCDYSFILLSYTTESSKLIIIYLPFQGVIESAGYLTETVITSNLDTKKLQAVSEVSQWYMTLS